LEGKRIALLGLAFKPGTDDVRSAPALALALRLISEGATVTAADPAVGEAAVEPVEGLKLAADPYSCATGAACLVICTDWPEFSEIDLRKLAGVMADPVMIDARNTIDPASARAAGFAYRGVGRAEVPG
jgi:UDPglucose 6-dehydrogenase